jgi:hypothetical protein
LCAEQRFKLRIRFCVDTDVILGCRHNRAATRSECSAVPSRC